MDSKQIAVNTATLQKDIDDLKLKLKEINKSIDDMSADISGLNLMWQGTANTTFNTQFQLDYHAMEEMCNSLNELIACMEFARNEYNKCEELVREAINEIQI